MPPNGALLRLVRPDGSQPSMHIVGVIDGKAIGIEPITKKSIFDLRPGDRVMCDGEEHIVEDIKIRNDSEFGWLSGLDGEARAQPTGESCPAPKLFGRGRVVPPTCRSQRASATRLAIFFAEQFPIR